MDETQGLKHQLDEANAEIARLRQDFTGIRNIVDASLTLCGSFGGNYARGAVRANLEQIRSIVG
jgi:hypothetical protein